MTIFPKSAAVFIITYTIKAQNWDIDGFVIKV